MLKMAIIKKSSNILKFFRGFPKKKTILYMGGFLMKKIYTVSQAIGPMEIEVQRELYKRKALNEEETLEYHQKEVRDIEINGLIHLIEDYGDPSWEVMIDFIFDVGVPRIDLILFTHYGMYVVQCHNPIYKSWKKSLSVTKEIHQSLTGFFDRIKLEANMKEPILVTSEIESGMEIAADDLSIDVMNFDQFREFLLNISLAEKNKSTSKLDWYDIIHWLGYQDDKYIFTPLPVEDEMKFKVKPGIMCKFCDSFSVTRHENHIECECGDKEDFEEAIVRTIREWGIIHHDQYLEVFELLEFLCGMIEREQLNE